VISIVKAGNLQVPTVQEFTQHLTESLDFYLEILKENGIHCQQFLIQDTPLNCIAIMVIRI
jgi:hypothetical protein